MQTQSNAPRTELNIQITAHAGTKNAMWRVGNRAGGPYVPGTKNRPRNVSYGNSGGTERFRLWPTRPLAVAYPKAIIARERTVRDGRSSRRTAPSGMRRLAPSWRWRAGRSIDVGARAWPWYRRHSGPSWSARLDRVVTKRDDAVRVLAADPIMALPCFDRRKVGAGRSGQDNGNWPQGVESATQ
jgi:hypothetical protein